MGDVLSVMLAIGVSTEQEGDQLFLQVVGDPGTAKTRFCDAMLTSRGCYHLANLTGFTSGWKSGQEGAEDHSLLVRINRRTLITPEADVLVTSPTFGEIMGHARRIFDGKFAQDYKTLKEQRSYDALRTPWILAGTPAMMMSIDHARQGDRFLRVFMDVPDADGREAILRMVCHGALRSVARRSVEDDAASCMSPEMLNAYRLTGGYVDHLRRNPDELIASVAIDEDAFVPEVMALAEFAADLRAKPDPDKKREQQRPTKELPSRLAIQLARLGA